MGDRISYEITVADSGECFSCRDGQNVLLAMERLGRQAIPVGCRGGGCGICRVQVLGEGRYRTMKMSRAQVTAADEAKGICLACKLIPEGDLEIRALGALRKSLG
jgi:ferredoxin